MPAETPQVSFKESHLSSTFHTAPQLASCAQSDKLHGRENLDDRSLLLFACAPSQIKTLHEFYGECIHGPSARANGVATKRAALEQLITAGIQQTQVFVHLQDCAGHYYTYFFNYKRNVTLGKVRPSDNIHHYIRLSAHQHLNLFCKYNSLVFCVRFHILKLLSTFNTPWSHYISEMADMLSF